MRYLVISDIHGNLEALDAVIGAMTRARLRPRARPRGSRRLRRRPQRGRRSRALAEPAHASFAATTTRSPAGLETGDSFNLVARSAVQWTTDALTPENLEYLRSCRRARPPWTTRCEICHGSPFDEDAYIFDELDALHAFEAATRPVCLFGHTHVAIAFRRLPIDSSCRLGPATPIRSASRSTARALPGQRRLRRPATRQRLRAPAQASSTPPPGSSSSIACGMPIEEAQRKIRLAGLPEILARRLALGR